MDLRSFISEALVQIARGIEDANGELKKSKSFAIVNPRNVTIVDGGSGGKLYGRLDDGGGAKGKTVQRIDFDVAVSVATGKEARGGIGIMVGSVGLGGQAKKNDSSSSVSRIQFSVPICLPTGTRM